MNIVVAEVDEGLGRIALQSEYRDRELCKMIPGSQWDGQLKTWTLPLSWAACHQLRGVFSQRLQIGPKLSAWSWHEFEHRVKPCMDLRLAVDGEGDERLFAFQKPGVWFLAFARQALLADEMGTGKTVQAIMALKKLHDAGEDVFPCLIVAPNSVKTVWAKHFAQWWPDVDVQVVTGSAAARRKAIEATTQVAVCNYQSTWAHSRLKHYGSYALKPNEKEPKDLNFVPWRTVIVDEAHRIKDPKSKQTRAVWFIGHQPTVKIRFALTGTPLANAPDDLWAIMHFVCPEEYPTKTKYVDRYCLLSWNAFGGMNVIGVRPETKDEFFAFLDPRMRRMPKELVLPFLPPKLRTRREVEMSAKQAKAYRQMEQTMMAETADGHRIYATEVLSRNTRLMQFSSAFAVLNDDGEVRLSDPSNKLDEMMDWLEELGDDPAVVFAESRQLIALAGARLLEKGISHAYIVGGMTDQQRDQSVELFQTGHARVMLCTIKAGGEGITLTRAGHCGFLQRSWSMLENKQAEDRVHRIGSEVHDKIHITDFVSPGTVEEGQIDKLYEKLERLQEIVRDKQTVATVEERVRLEAEEAAILAEALYN